MWESGYAGGYESERICRDVSVQEEEKKNIVKCMFDW